MKKSEQMAINQKCVDAYKEINAYYAEYRFTYCTKKRLRYCNAWVYTCKDYTILQSYNTIVAVIFNNTKEGFDFLRYTYGYTATSAQHISKFFYDYYAQKTYRYV